MKAAPARLADLIRPPTLTALISGILAQDALGGAAEGWEDSQAIQPAVGHHHICPKCAVRWEHLGTGLDCRLAMEKHRCEHV